MRPPTELAGCTNPSNSNAASTYLDANGNPIPTSRFQVEVIKVPLAAPAQAAVVKEARLMADPVTGSPAGLWPGGSHGPNTQSTSATDACPDITVFEAIGVAAGACEGNGLLIGISDPANPVRTDVVARPELRVLARRHVLERRLEGRLHRRVGGGTTPRCRESDPLAWGGTAIFESWAGRWSSAATRSCPSSR